LNNENDLNVEDIERQNSENKITPGELFKLIK
jgi:hypothetical protein